MKYDNDKIYKKNTLKPKLSFDNMRFGNGATPTDIDAYIEFENKLFIVFEGKNNNDKIRPGQRTALERLVDSLNKPAVLIYFTYVRRKKGEVVEMASEVVSGFSLNMSAASKYNKIRLVTGMTCRDAVVLLRTLFID